MLSCQQQKRKLRLYISNTFNPARPDADDSDGSIASWELRVEGKLLDDVSLCLTPKVENQRGDCNLFVVLCFGPRPPSVLTSIKIKCREG